MKEKICPHCFLSFPETEEYFYKVPKTEYFRSYFKECMKDMQITNYDKHRGEILGHKKEYRKRKALQNSIGMLD